jgi:hypothetical protein
MARGTLIVAGIGALAVAGLALASKASAAPAAPGGAPLPPPPPPKPKSPGGILTPKDYAMSHAEYDNWLSAAIMCDQLLGVEGREQEAIDQCGAAAYYANIMVQDGVPPGEWR